MDSIDFMQYFCLLVLIFFSLFICYLKGDWVRNLQILFSEYFTFLQLCVCVCGVLVSKYS